MPRVPNHAEIFASFVVATEIERRTHVLLSMDQIKHRLIHHRPERPPQKQSYEEYAIGVLRKLVIHLR